MHTLRIICLMASLLTAVTAVTAEPGTDAPAPRHRPTIGLALGGGAARGFAHIGVLRWLEEHRIPVDYIAGTSMGGLMGGCYAMGMSAADIEALVGSVDWSEAFATEAPYARRDWRRKEDFRDLTIPFELGLKEGLRTPAGIDPVHQVGLLLSRLTAPYGGIASFDQLPIAFRCVATDITNAEQVVMSDGSLALALRATMAIPGVFTPVEWNGKLLADGGVLNMVPADVVRGMGADIVIAVDVGARGSRDAGDSLLGVISQTVTVVMLDNTRRAIASADVIIAPELGGSNAWTAYKESADAGYRAIDAKAPLLTNLSLSVDEWQQHLQQRQERKRQQLPDVGFIDITGVSGRLARQTLAEVNWQIGTTLDTVALDNSLTDIIGKGRLASLAYDTVHRDDQSGLQLRAVEKTYGPPFLRVGLSLNNSRGRQMDSGILARITFMDFGAADAEARVDLGIGSSRTASMEYYRLLEGRRWFGAARAGIAENTRDHYAGSQRINEHVLTTYSVSADIGAVLHDQAEWRIGYQTGYITTAMRMSGPRLSYLTGGNEEFLRARYAWDYWNDDQLPTAGSRGSAEFRHFLRMPGHLRHINQASLQASLFHPLDTRSQAFTLLSADSSFGQSVGWVNQFEMGGLFQLGGHARGRLTGPSRLYGAAGLMRQISSSVGPLSFPVRMAAWLETGSVYRKIGEAQFEQSLGVGLLFDTPLGPAYICGSLANEVDRRLLFGIGRLFPW